MTDSHQSPTPLLQIDRLEAVYDGVIVALRGISLRVDHGAVVALLGANGAGKTTTLKAASSLLASERGQVVAGAVRLAGEVVSGLSPNRLVELGVAQVLEGRHVFAHQTVEDNLKLGGFVRRPSRAALQRGLERVYTRFPRLKTLRRHLAGYASGGEQQMLAIGRALMANPRLVLLDEPSMGLAPIVVHEIFEGIRQLNQEEGVSFLLAEQNATIALQYADFGYVLETGRVVLEGRPDVLQAQGDVQRFYLGGGDAQRRSFIDPHQIRKFHAATRQGLQAVV